MAQHLLPRVLVDGKGRPLVTDAETLGRPLEGLAPTVYELAVRAMDLKLPADTPADTLMIFYRAPDPWP